MDIAALIFAPLLLALVYSRARIGQLPHAVLVGLPTGLLAIIFIALLGYGPAVQEAIATRTPLVRDFGGRIFAMYLDGLSLLFALLITGIGAVIALYAGTYWKDRQVYRRFAQAVLIYIGLTLALALTDNIDLLPHFLTFTFLPLLFMSIEFGAPRAVNASEEDGNSSWPRWKQRLLILGLYVAFFLPYALLRFGITFLTELGGAATPTVGGTSGLALFSGYNLSHKISYEAFFLLTLVPLLFYSLCIVWRWRSAKNLPVVVHGFLSASIMSSMFYLFTRFYPAVHDNPLWWSVVTGVGLLVMLIGAVWSLRQTDTKAILIYRTMGAFGACLALLGLPEFIGYKVALIGIVAHALSGAALFLSLESNRKSIRWMIQGLALLPMAIFHVLMIGAFYRLTLAWAGIALAVVIVSTALWVVSMIRVIGDPSDEMGRGSEGRPTGHVDIALESPLQVVVPGVLSLASLVAVLLFDVIFVPLLNPIVMPKGVVGDATTPLILSVVALVGGIILYGTRNGWGRFIQPKPMLQIDNVHEH